MPKYKVLVKHTYEQDQFIELDACDQEEANRKATHYKWSTWDNTDLTHIDMTIMEVEEITNA
tara:strand:- start:757 stop:942 length:186 start_codon:yes stop_codon:yes gene_type:complete